MNAAQIHLALNHFPIAGMFFALPILLWGLLTKKDLIKSVGIAVIIAGAIGAIAVMQTGEGTEEMVEHKPGVTKELIHEHEEAAEGAMVVMQITAVLGIAWLVMNKLNKNHKEKIFMIMLITNLAAAIMVANAAHKGGQIRHEEIRDQAGNADTQKAIAPEAEETEEKETH